MFILVLLFGMFIAASGYSNITLVMVIFYMKLSHHLVRLSTMVYVKWVYEIDVKDVTDDAG